MQSGWNKPGRQCYRQGSPWSGVGLALIAAGLILLFSCVPGWAWAAIAGVLLIAAGYVLIRLSKNGR